MATNNIKKLVVVGGGTAGWMTAASMAAYLNKSDIEITVVDSSEIAPIGVGEATIPSIRRFYAKLGMGDAQVMQATNATCKLGISFVDWHRKGESYFHPFGHYGQSIGHVGFEHFLQRLRQEGDVFDLEDYSLSTVMAKRGKFIQPSTTPTSPLSVYDWALHFDAGLFANLMKGFSEQSGVVHINANVQRCTLTDSGFIEHLVLDDGSIVDGDLFIDCTGFSALLIGKALNTEYIDWSNWLKTDSAIVVQSSPSAKPSPYTESRAHIAGWQWRIPLQNRDGNGHVYSSRYLSDDEAESILRRNLKGEMLAEPRKISFQVGRRDKAWNKNCIAVGLSSGFLEPLESTSIALIENALERIKLLFPDKSFNQSCIDEFNEMTRLEYERCRDFIILHYKKSSRDDSAFWCDCRNLPIPEQLQHKIDVYQSRGHFVKYRWEIFQSPSWLALYNGNRIHSERWDPFVENFELDYLRKSFAEMKESIANGVADMDDHDAFLREVSLG